MAGFLAGSLDGSAVQQLEVVVRLAVFKSVNALVGYLLQAAADQADAAYQPRPWPASQRADAPGPNCAQGWRPQNHRPGPRPKRGRSADGARAAAVEKALGYFEHNVERMQYGTFRKAGYFIGSGVVEAGCKTVIGARCKHSGMHWSDPGAQNILGLRCIERSRRWPDFWKLRANDHAARNDILSLSA